MARKDVIIWDRIYVSIGHVWPHGRAQYYTKTRREGTDVEYIRADVAETELARLREEMASAWVLMASMETLVPDEEHPAWVEWFERNHDSLRASIAAAKGGE